MIDMIDIMMGMVMVMVMVSVHKFQFRDADQIERLWNQDVVAKQNHKATIWGWSRSTNHRNFHKLPSNSLH